MAMQLKSKTAPKKQNEAASRQPAWRQQAPAKPRKRVRRKQFSAAALKEKSKAGRALLTPPALVMPTRETWLMVLRIAGLVLAAALITAGLIYLLRWPVLAVRHESTQIGGSQRITPEEIYVTSGIDGRNVLLLRADQIAAQIAAMPGMATADVHIRLPNQVIIDVTEHAPLVAWESITTTVWLAVDGSQVPQAGLPPPVRLVDQTAGRLDKDAALKALVLDNLQTVHKARPSLTEFYYGNQEGLYYRTEDGWDVWLGDAGPLETKLDLVDAVTRDILAQGGRPKVIDVRQSERKAMWW